MSNHNSLFWFRKIVAFWGILIIPAIPSSAVLSQSDSVDADLLNKENVTCLSKGINSKRITKPSGIDRSIPYLISPRNTVVATRQPKLHWNPVSGATSYTVKIVTGSKIIWEKTLKEAEFNSSEELPLEPGIDYSLIVESDNGRSSEKDSDISSTTFQLLDRDKIESLANKEKNITELGLTKDEEALELAHLHFSESGLLAKSIERLEQRIAAKSQTSEIYVAVASLYKYTGLYYLAEDRYKKALELIEPGKELEEQIIAKGGLAQIQALLGDDKEANRLNQERDADLKTLLINRKSRNIIDSLRVKAEKRMDCDCPNDPDQRKTFVPGICSSDCIPDTSHH